MPRRFRHSWTCPACGAQHTWSWPDYDKPDHGEKVWMECEECPAKTAMRWMGKQGWVETPEDSPNFLDASN